MKLLLCKTGDYRERQGRVTVWDAGFSCLEGSGNSRSCGHYFAARVACWQARDKVTSTASATPLCVDCADVIERFCANLASAFKLRSSTLTCAHAAAVLSCVLQLEAANKELGSLLVFLKESLSDRIEKVVLTDRLLDSPCALVTSKFGWSANMERIMRSQAMGDSRAMEYMKGRKILEINPQHEIVRGIKVGLGAYVC